MHPAARVPWLPDPGHRDSSSSTQQLGAAGTAGCHRRRASPSTAAESADLTSVATDPSGCPAWQALLSLLATGSGRVGSGGNPYPSPTCRSTEATSGVAISRSPSGRSSAVFHDGRRHRRSPEASGRFGRLVGPRGSREPLALHQRMEWGTGVDVRQKGGTPPDVGRNRFEPVDELTIGGLTTRQRRRPAHAASGGAVALGRGRLWVRWPHGANRCRGRTVMAGSPGPPAPVQSVQGGTSTARCAIQDGVTPGACRARHVWIFSGPPEADRVTAETANLGRRECPRQRYAAKRPPPFAGAGVVARLRVDLVHSDLASRSRGRTCRVPCSLRLTGCRPQSLRSGESGESGNVAGDRLKDPALTQTRP
jgi:hypothetical protein